MMNERGLRREIPSLSPGLLQIALHIKTSLCRTLFIENQMRLTFIKIFLYSYWDNWGHTKILWVVLRTF